MLLDLQAKIVLDRLRKARVARKAHVEHETGPNSEFYFHQAKFWEEAARKAAAGDLSPVTFRDPEGEATEAEGIRVILVVVR